MFEASQIILAVSQIIGAVVALSCAVIGVIYIKSKSEGMQTFYDRAAVEFDLAYGLHLIIQKSTFVYGALFPGTLGSNLVLILSVINQAAMLSFCLHFISFSVIKYISIYHESVLHVDEDKVIRRLRYCFWISAPILETVDMLWLTDSTLTLPSKALVNGVVAGPVTFGKVIDIVIALHLISFIGVHLRNEYTNCQSEASTEEVEQSSFNLFASRMILIFMFLGIVMLYFLHPYFDDSPWVQMFSMLLISSTLDVLLPLLMMLYNRKVRIFIVLNVKRRLCFTDNIVHVME
jgi:hypothetical protein